MFLSKTEFARYKVMRTSIKGEGKTSYKFAAVNRTKTKLHKPYLHSYSKNQFFRPLLCGNSKMYKY